MRYFWHAPVFARDTKYEYIRNFMQAGFDLSHWGSSPERKVGSLRGRLWSSSPWKEGESGIICFFIKVFLFHSYVYFVWFALFP